MGRVLFLALLVCGCACRRTTTEDPAPTVAAVPASTNAAPSTATATPTPTPVAPAPLPSQSVGAPITRVAPGSPDTVAPWAKKLAAADAKASFERDFRKRMPGTRYTESAAGVSIDYECTVDELVVSQTSSKSVFKATVRARLDSYLTMNGPPKHAQDAGTFVFYPTVEEGRWACAPKESNGKATISDVPNFPMALPCMNIATQCLGRHASPAEFDIALGK